MFDNEEVPQVAAKAKRIKCFHQHLPLYPGEEESLNADIHLLAMAKTKEKKSRDRCALTCTDPVKGPKARYNYLRSLACLRAKMLEANGRRPYRKRLSLRQIIEAAKQYKILIELNEPVNVFAEPKPSGDGWRTIYDFGLVARGAQRMISALLHMDYKPAPFQYTSLGVHAAIQEALRLITEEGYSYVAELDIKGHYPSFEVNRLIKTLPLPKQAVKQIVVATSAKWDVHSPSPLLGNHTIHPTPSGIPPGSVASTTVAEWSVSQLKMIKVKDIALVNYADNFFLFGKNLQALEFALEALRSAVAGMPGGVFHLHPEPDVPGTIRSVTDGFWMLGCTIVKTEHCVEVSPTASSTNELQGQFWLEAQMIEAVLLSADLTKDQQLRFEGTQAFLGLRSYVRSWMAAHAMCTDIEVHTEDMRDQLDCLAVAYGLTETELKAAADASIRNRYYPKSNLAAY